MPTKTDATLAATPILEALSARALPWSEDSDRLRLIIATPTFKEWSAANQHLPDNVSASPRRVQGRRSVVRSADPLADGYPIFRWREDGTETLKEPMLASIIGGRTDFHVSDYFIHCPAGYFILVPPGVQHPTGLLPHIEARDGEVNSCDVMWLRPWGRVLRCWMCHSTVNGHEGLRRNESCFVFAPPAMQYFDDMVTEAVARPANYQRVCRGLLAALLAILHRQISQGHLYIATWAAGGLESQESQSIARSQDYIRTNLQGRLTIDNVARITNMSRSEFTRRFREETGQTFTEYLTECRMQVAKTLLTETDWPIQLVATFVGITGTHLRELFLKQVEMSPIEFRRSFQPASGPPEKSANSFAPTR